MRTVTLIKGDGIGPEIAEAVKVIFAKANIPITWEEAEAGLSAIERIGTGVPQETLDSIRRNGVALKGPTTTPVGGGHKSVNVTIRKTLELYANVRLAKSMPAVPTRYDGVNILVVRENIEDTYAGIEHMQTPNVAQALKIITRQGSMAVIRYAFEEARKLGRRRVTCVHKANIHKITDGLFLEVFRQVASEYTDIEANDIIVDNCCMQLVSRPEQFDVLVLPNLYGDIVSDLCAGIVGGLGIAPGGNIGKDCAVFEAVHGSAPDIAGKGLANPSALLLSSVQMLQYLGMVDHAESIMDALTRTLAAGVKTKDLGGNASTKEFADAVANNIRTVVTEMDHDELVARVSHPVPPQIKEEWVTIGTDVFVEWSGSLPPVPKNVGPLTLTNISNLGTTVWPGDLPDILLVDHYRCRYIGENITTKHVTDLLQLFDESNIRWCHVEQLCTADGMPRYSKSAGE